MMRWFNRLSGLFCTSDYFLFLLCGYLGIWFFFYYFIFLCWHFFGTYFCFFCFLFRYIRCFHL
ncbi:MAG TPA: hypothetical protein ENK39_03105 [Epsilonproteobacteria bacterium]|nr:hypothetical protein [Campylobacterota bacterium]